MNREIKFRAWVTKGKFIVHNESYMATQGEPDLETLSSFMHHYSEEPLLMQYTGLKDKNGKEIFEGDILKSWYSRDMSGKDIVWMTYAVEYEICEGTGTSGFQIEFLNNAEIIGNIYENEELIN